MSYLFTIIAFFVVGGIGIFAARVQNSDTDDMETNAKHSRQDLRLIAYLLMAIVIMLGIIADRIH